jgi:serine/threonine-protein kinase
LLVGTVGQASSDSVPVGDVVSQDPSAFTSVAKGSKVDFVISTGTPTPSSSPSVNPSGTPITVPSVVTMPESQAETLLKSDGFVVKVKQGSSSLASGEVYQQDPVAGGTATPGSVVTIWVTK